MLIAKRIVFSFEIKKAVKHAFTEKYKNKY